MLGLKHPSPPLPSPSRNIAALNDQRDHSACGRLSSPLKVRKTRENLRQAVSTYADIPPPCLHHAPDPLEIPACREFMVTDPPNTIATSLITGDNKTAKLLWPSTDYQDESVSQVVSAPSDAPPKISRHKSISRRMLSRVKDEISQRSMSAKMIQIPGADPEASLLRRLSNKRKEGLAGSRRMQSFEIRRISNESSAENRSSEIAPFRSISTSTTSTIEPVGSATSATRPRDPIMILDSHGRYPSTPPPASQPSSPDPTPRPSQRDASCDRLEALSLNHFAVPYVHLETFLSRAAVDVALEREVWIAIEATVRTRASEAKRVSSDLRCTFTNKVDVVILLSRELQSDDQDLAWKFITQLALLLNHSADQLAILLLPGSHSRQGCEVLHPLKPPDLSLLSFHACFKSTGIEVPSDCRDGTNTLPLSQAIQVLRQQGLRDQLSNFVLISGRPENIAKHLNTRGRLRLHRVLIGIRRDELDGRTEDNFDATPGWRLELPSHDDLGGEVMSNLVQYMRQDGDLGMITSLRLCFKPLECCHITDVVGQKARKGLKLGQRCRLFLKILVPRSQTHALAAEVATNSDSLLLELESIIGTLETSIVHVEARYRHSLLPHNSVVTVREIVSIKRPKADSRWSISGPVKENASPWAVYRRLAHYLAAHESPARALKLMDRWIPQQYAVSPAVVLVRDFLASTIPDPGSDFEYHPSMSKRPSVVITNTDASSGWLATPPHDESNAGEQCADASTSRRNSPQAPPFDVAVLHPCRPSSPRPPPDDVKQTTPDAARQLWRHIRRSSRSVHQLLELSQSSAQQLVAGDERLQELRTKALANKRSVGAETLRDWRWEDRAAQGGEMPWM